jgi:hypothetical protein
MYDPPAKSLSTVTGRMNTPPKVPDLQFSFDAQQKILGLDVSMDHMLSV